MTDEQIEAVAQAGVIAGPYGEPVTTLDELSSLDDSEMVEGYFDGFSGEPEPKGNRSKSYWHGWRNGNADLTGKVDAAQSILARKIVREHLKEAGE